MENKLKNLNFQQKSHLSISVPENYKKIRELIKNIKDFDEQVYIFTYPSNYS